MLRLTAGMYKWFSHWKVMFRLCSSWGYELDAKELVLDRFPYSFEAVLSVRPCKGSRSARS